MISVVIPVYNGEKYLDECLSSVAGTNVEIIVVNDASNDNSEQIARKHTKNVISIAHAGPVIARNQGLHQTHGDYIVFMDADDILKPDALKNMQNEIGDFDVVIGLRQDFISPDCTDTIQNKKSQHGVIAGCALFKKSAFDKVGDFDTDLLCGDGYDWILRAEKQGIKIKKSNTVFCMRRIHNSNMGKTMAAQEKLDYVKIIKKHFMGKQ